jgi:membrane protein implicated in regulation of membrane protease activity
METPFLVCAILGSTLLLCQMLTSLLGFGADHDTDAGADSDSAGDHGDGLFGIITLRTVTAAVLFFGLGGRTALYYEASEPRAIAFAFAAGIAAFYAVAAIMRSLARLQSDGTVRIERAVGRAGTVYLRIPGGRSSAGKIHLMLQNRTVEYQAITTGTELPTGTPVKVVAVVGPDTVEVEAA